MRHTSTKYVTGLALAGLGFFWPCLAALAADTAAKPLVIPLRDVVVDYQMRFDATGQEVHSSAMFAKNGAQVRFNAPDGRGYTIFDRKAGKMFVVLDKPRLYMEAPQQQSAAVPVFLDGASGFARKGGSAVAGLRCIMWDVTFARGVSQACITPDGVVLSMKGVDADGVKGSFVVTKVAYRPIPAANFRPPAGYQRVVRPASPKENH